MKLATSCASLSATFLREASPGSIGVAYLHRDARACCETSAYRADRQVRAMTISHLDHPAVYIFILSVSLVAVPFYSGMLYTYYFKKIPD